MKKLYIIYCHRGVFGLSKSSGWPGLDESDFSKGILCFGNPAIVFTSRKAAEIALERTKRYADIHYKNWREWLDKAYIQQDSALLIQHRRSRQSVDPFES